MTPGQTKNNKKIASTKVFAQLARIALFETPRFLLRRGVKRSLRRKRTLQEASNVVLIDMSGTLCKTDTSEEMLNLMFGEPKGSELYKQYREQVKQGKLSMEEAMLQGANKLAEARIREGDYDQLLAKLLAEGKIRNDVLEVARYLKKHGRTVVLATRESEILANKLVKHYPEHFDFAIGTKETIVDGKILGVERLIGGRKGKVRGHPIITKMDALKEQLITRGEPYSPKRISVLTDGYDDIAALKKAGFSILLTPKSAATHQKLAKRFRLADVLVEESPGMVHELKLRLRHPWTIKAPQGRIDKATTRLAQIRQGKNIEKITGKPPKYKRTARH